MNKPDYRIDYTDIALEVYEMAMWKGYKFLKDRTLDAWLNTLGRCSLEEK